MAMGKADILYLYLPVALSSSVLTYMLAGWLAGWLSISPRIEGSLVKR